MSKAERVISRVAIVITALVASFLVFELGFRLLVSFKSRDAWEANDRIHVPRPYVMAVADPELETINSLGYKGALPVVPKPMGEKRIFFLGGSVVFGLDPYGESIESKALPELVEQRLQRKYGKHVKVFNFGITSTVAIQELVRLAIDVSNFEPDVVVSYGGGNDLMSGKRVGYPHRFIFYEVNPLWKTEMSDYPLFHLIAFGSQVIRHLFKNSFEDYFISQARSKPFSASGVESYTDRLENYVSALEKMNIFSKSLGAKFISFFQPLKLVYFGAAERKNYVLKWVAEAKRRLRRDGSEVLFVDFSKVLSGQPESVWEDEIHLFDPGNELVADKIALEISREYNEVLSPPLKN